MKLPELPKPGSGRNVSERCDFDLRSLEAQQTQAFADDRMLDLRNLVDMLQMRIFQINSLGEGSRHRDKDVLVDGGRKQEAFVLPVIRTEDRCPPPPRVMRSGLRAMIITGPLVNRLDDLQCGDRVFEPA